MPRPKLSDSTQQQVRHRARGLCEYCHANERWQYVQFTIDHVIPLSAGGSSDPSNLALACFHCNRRKFNRSDSLDPQTDIAVALFDPRRDRWSDHFIWARDNISLIGLTPQGRATIALLDLNRPRILAIRAADREISRHPPATDPIQS